MFCENCGSEIKDTDKICPKCGRVVESAMVRPVKKVEPKPNADGTTLPEGAKVVNHRKKSGKGVAITLSIIAAVVVLLAVVCVFNMDRISNLVYSFGAPEKYYAYVEQKNVEDMAELVAVQYEGNLTPSFFPLNTMRHLMRDGAVEMDMDFTLGEGTKDLMDMAKASGVDLSWIQNGKLNAQIAMKGNALAIGADMDVNETDLISTNMIVDLNQDGMYLQIPELTDKYLGINDMGLFDSEMQDALMMVRNIMNECPSKDLVKMLMSRYATTVIGSIKDVEKETGYELTAGDITQKCTKLEVALTEDNWKAICEAVAAEAKADTDLRNLVTNMCNATGKVDGAAAYDEFAQALDLLKDYYTPELRDLKMSVYVDNKGVIRGRDFELEIEGAGYEYISYRMPVKGKNYALEVTVEQEGVVITVTGSGTQTADMMDGTYVFAADGTNFLEMKITEYDIAAEKAGNVNMKMEMSFAPEAKDLINEELDDSYGEYAGMIARMLSEFKIVSDVQSTADSSVEECVVSFGEDEFMTIHCTVNAVAASDIQIPEESNVISMEDSETAAAYLEAIDWMNLRNNLEKMNLPAEYLEAVDGFVSMMTMYGSGDMFGMEDMYDMEDSADMEDSYDDADMEEVLGDYDLSDLSEEELEQLNELMEMYSMEY